MATSSKGGSSSRRSGSTLQKIAQKKEQLKQLPRMKKIERVCVHLSCQVIFNPLMTMVSLILSIIL